MMKFIVIWNEDSYGKTEPKTVPLSDFIKRKDDWNLLEHTIDDLIDLNIGKTLVECSPLGWEIIIVKISNEESA